MGRGPREGGFVKGVVRRCAKPGWKGLASAFLGAKVCVFWHLLLTTKLTERFFENLFKSFIMNDLFISCGRRCDEEKCEIPRIAIFFVFAVFGRKLQQGKGLSCEFG